MERNEELLHAGVAPGGLYTREQIRLLLCDLVCSCSSEEPLSAALAEQVFAQEGLANYFEYHAALQQLLEEGHLYVETREREMVLFLSEHSKNAVHHLLAELPRNVRDRALHCAEELRRRRSAGGEQNLSVYSVADGGCYMTFRQGTEEELLLRLTVYVPERAQAERIREKFSKNPSEFYQAILSYFL